LAANFLVGKSGCAAIPNARSKIFFGDVTTSWPFGHFARDSLFFSPGLKARAGTGVSFRRSINNIASCDMKIALACKYA
jgi:hypothetical protein